MHHARSRCGLSSFYNDSRLHRATYKIYASTYGGITHVIMSHLVVERYDDDGLLHVVINKDGGARENI